MNSPAAAPSADPRRTWGLLVCGALLAVVFAPTLWQLSRVWDLDPNYSHGYFILPVSLWLAWRTYQSHPVPDQGDVIQGAFTLGLGLTVQISAVVLRNIPIEFAAMLLVLRGTLVLIGGQKWANQFLFPMFFLAFLFPLPVGLTTQIAVWLQDVMATASAEVLGWFFLCFRRGSHLHVAGLAEPLRIAEECSGVRQMMAFLAMGTLVAHLGGLGFLRGTLLVVLAVSVAIVTNVIRVVLMVVGVVYFGPTWLSQRLHDLPGLLTLPVGIAMLFSLMWLISPSEAKKTPAPAEGSP
jgi:exosortase